MRLLILNNRTDLLNNSACADPSSLMHRTQFDFRTDIGYDDSIITYDLTDVNQNSRRLQLLDLQLRFKRRNFFCVLPDCFTEKFLKKFRLKTTDRTWSNVTVYCDLNPQTLEPFTASKLMNMLKHSELKSESVLINKLHDILT